MVMPMTITKMDTGMVIMGMIIMGMGPADMPTCQQTLGARLPSELR